MIFNSVCHKPFLFVSQRFCLEHCDSFLDWPLSNKARIRYHSRNRAEKKAEWDIGRPLEEGQLAVLGFCLSGV
jgi:hypothetical protein